MTTPRAPRSLYISYFGLREPLVQTQVLPYLRQIRRGGVEVSLLTFEPDRRRAWPAPEIRAWRIRLGQEGIRWFCLPYHKRPTLPATLADIAAGAWLAARLARREGIDVLHARGHMAAAMGALAKRTSKARLIFDIRGFMPEEYVDAGLWPAEGYLFRGAKAAERRLLAAADGFVVLTERARDILFPGYPEDDRPDRPVEVIPCCVDLERFRSADGLSREAVREDLGLQGRRVLVYVGALGGWYLTQEMADFLGTARQQDRSTFAMILTQSAPEMIAEPLRRLGYEAQDYLIRRVPPEEIPRYLKGADLALSFIKQCYSKLSSSPTKVAEYLASGVPVVSNAGIGDLDHVIAGDGVGVLLKELNREAYLQALGAAERLRREPKLADRCRACAQDRFDLETVGGVRYRRLYQCLLSAEAGAPLPLQVRG